MAEWEREGERRREKEEERERERKREIVRVEENEVNRGRRELNREKKE